MARRTRPHRPLFPRGAGVGFRAFLFALAAISIWFADQRGIASLVELRNILATALQPVLSLAAAPVSLKAAGDQLRANRLLLEENRQLLARQLELNAKLLTFESLQAENRRIRQLVTSSSSLHQRVSIAEIISVNQDPYRHQITLDKGANEGVYQGQAVADAFGVMGQVIRVNPTYSTALLITDTGHGIPVEVNRTGLQTIARGGGDGRTLVLPFLPGNADVQVGDLLVTSGLGGRFPPGYPVGMVFDVKRGTAVHFMQATATPMAHLYQSRQVLLIWNDRPAPVGEALAEPNPDLPPPAANLPDSKLPQALAPPAGPAPSATAPVGPAANLAEPTPAAGPLNAGSNPAVKVPTLASVVEDASPSVITPSPLPRKSARKPASPASPPASAPESLPAAAEPAAPSPAAAATEARP